MARRPPTKADNYRPKLAAFVQSMIECGALEVGQGMAVEIKHEPDCDYLSGGGCCNCEPAIKVHADA